jgi:hypothetical protein
MELTPALPLDPHQQGLTDWCGTLKSKRKQKLE